MSLQPPSPPALSAALTMNPITSIFGGVAIFGIIASCWRTLLMILNKIKSLFIVGFTSQPNGHDEINAVVAYLRKHYKRIGGRQWSYGTDRKFRRSKQRYVLSPLKSFLAENDIVMFYRKGSILFVGAQQPKNGEGRGSAISVWTMRGMLNPDDFFQKAIEEYDQKAHEEELTNGRNKRFHISFWTGMRGMKGEVDKTCSAGEIAQDRKDTLTLRSCFIPLGFKWEDIIEDASSEKEIYALTDYLRDAYEEADFWLKSKQWYYERGIPWRRGWLMVGKPGTGKTAFVRWMARRLDLPITSFDLATYTNREFTGAWLRLSDKSPCIALIEDIDAVFNGRKNITDTNMEKGVTFDCFLNCLDGIQRNDGIFVIITSNRPETIDPAIGISNGEGDSTRPGRIDRIIEVVPLNDEQKREIAANILKGFEGLVPVVMEKGKKDSGACFMERCRSTAERALWEQKKLQEDEVTEPVKVA